MSRSANVKHAFKTGLNDHVCGVLVRDHQEKKDLTFQNLRECLEHFGVDPTLGMWLVTRHKHTKYLNRYTFTITRYKTPETDRKRDVCLVDLVHGKYYRAESVSWLAYLTDINSRTVLSYLGRYKGRLFRGCLIWEYGHYDYGERLNTITEKEIQESLDRYKASQETKNNDQRTKGYLVKNYVTGEITQHRYISHVTEATGIDKKRLRSQISEGTLNLVDGYAIKRQEDTRDFVDHHPLKVKFSVEGLLSNTGKIIRVAELSSNTTDYYPSFPVFARTIGKDPDGLRNKLKTTGLDGYDVTFL